MVRIANLHLLTNKRKQEKIATIRDLFDQMHVFCPDTFTCQRVLELETVVLEVLEED